MKLIRAANILLLFIGAILVIDELWMFGIPVGPILPDLSAWHVEPFHHWMVGLVMIVLGLFFLNQDEADFEG